MTVTYREGVAILDVVVYVPFALLAIFLATRHGFSKSSGWFYLILFCLVRMTGGILQIISSQTSNPGTKRDVIVGAYVCNSIGLSPLNLMVLGMLSRVNDFVTVGHGKIPTKTFKLVGFISIAAVALSATGGSDSTFNADGSVTIDVKSKVGNVMFLAIFIFQVVVAAYLSTRMAFIEKGEKRLILAVALASPFLVVRYAYTLEYVFSGRLKFSPVFGSVTLYLILSVLMEIIVVLICLAIGLTLQKRRKEENQEVEMTHSSTYNGSKVQSRTQRPRRKANGPITWVIYAIQDHRERSRSAPSH